MYICIIFFCKIMIDLKWKILFVGCDRIYIPCELGNNCMSICTWSFLSMLFQQLKKKKWIPLYSLWFRTVRLFLNLKGYKQSKTNTRNLIFSVRMKPKCVAINTIQDVHLNEIRLLSVSNWECGWQLSTSCE